MSDAALVLARASAGVCFAGGYSMSGIMKRIRTWFASFLSVETLSREQKLMLFAVLFFFCATGVSGVYINLFLYQTTVNAAGLAVTDALTSVIVFNLLAYIFMFIISGLLGVFGKRIPEKLGLLGGMGVYAILFVLLLVLGGKAIRSIAWLALLNACGTSLFQLSYNRMLAFAFPERTKKLYIIISSALITIAGILTPIIAGIFVQNGRNMNGYTVAFGTALVMIAISIAFVVCVRLPKNRAQKRTYFAGVLVRVLQERNLRLVHTGELLRGLRDGALAFLLPMVIYTSGGNALGVGFYAAICAVFQLLGELHVSKTVNAENRMGLMLFSVAIMLVATVAFAFGFNVMTVYAYGIISALVGAFFYVPIVGILHWSSGIIVNAQKKTTEIQQVRELFVNVGKALGALMVLVFYKLNLLPVAVILVNVVLVLAWVLFSRIGEETELQEIGRGLTEEKDNAD